MIWICNGRLWDQYRTDRNESSKWNWNSHHAYCYCTNIVQFDIQRSSILSEVHNKYSRSFRTIDLEKEMNNFFSFSLFFPFGQSVAFCFTLSMCVFGARFFFFYWKKLVTFINGDKLKELSIQVNWIALNCF